MRRSNEQTRRGREREIRPHSVVRAGSVVRQPPRDLKEKPWTNDDLNVMQLDIVDRAVFKTADKRDLVHKDDLTKWINGILAANEVCVTDMFQDFRDGHNLITLIEVLAHEKLNREKGKSRCHALQNVQTALDCLKRRNVKLINIRPDDIVDGNPKLTLALIWTLILHFQDINNSQISTRDFIVWCRDQITTLQELNMNASLTKSKGLLDELKYLRNVEMPQKQREKQKLLQCLSSDYLSFHEPQLDHDIRPESVEMIWHSLITTVADKEHELLTRIQQLEQLDALAEKVEGELKSFDQRISEMSSRISNLNGQVEKIHASNIFAMMSSLETDIALIEKPLQQCLKDSHVLVERNHEKSKQLCEEATRISQEHSQLKKMFLLKSSSKVTKSTTRDQSHHKSIDGLIKWCQDELSKVYQETWRSELSDLQADLDQHQKSHKVYDQFHTKVLQAERQSPSLSPNEVSIYQQSLNELKKVYSELLSLSTKRLCDLQVLFDFVAAATDEIAWLKSREQIELSRDWSDVSLNLNDLNVEYKNTLREFHERKKEIEKVLLAQPKISNFEAPSKIIAHYTQEIQKHRSWFQQLINCFEVHFKHLAEYKHFYSDVEKHREWLISIKDQLDTKYSISDLTIEHGEVLLREMHHVHDDLTQFNAIIEKLAKQAEKIVVLRERSDKAALGSRNYCVKSLCTYSPNERILFEKGEIAELTGVATSSPNEWNVLNSKGEQVSAPNILFAIEPPNEEVCQLIDKLRLTQNRMIELCQDKHIQLRRNLIIATIRDVRNWSYDHFLSIGYDERQTIRRAINDDYNKILVESNGNDSRIELLKNEIIEVNNMLDEYESRTRSEDENKHATQIFGERCLLLSNRLENLAKELDGIILARFPQDKAEVEVTLEIIDDFLKKLGYFDTDLKHLKDIFMSIPMKTAAQKKNLERLIELLKELDTQTRVHQERMILLKDIYRDYDSNSKIARELENVLFSHFIMPSTLEGLRDLLKELTTLQENSNETQSAILQMNSNASQLGRMGVPTKTIEDLKILNTKLDKLNSRWSNSNLQLSDRIQSVETAIGLLKNLQTSLILEETWVETKSQKLKLLPASAHATDVDAFKSKCSLFGASKNHVNDDRQSSLENCDMFKISDVCETLIFELISKYDHFFHDIDADGVKELNLHSQHKQVDSTQNITAKPENELNSNSHRRNSSSDVPKFFRRTTATLTPAQVWKSFLNFYSRNFDCESIRGKGSKMSRLNENCSFLQSELEYFTKVQEELRATTNDFVEQLTIDEYLEYLEIRQRHEMTKKNSCQKNDISQSECKVNSRNPLKILKKLERRIVNLHEALKLRLINDDTFDLLSNHLTSNNITIHANNERYWIKDLESSRAMNLQQALDQDVLNLNDSLHLYLPFFKSLTIQQLFKRDLIEDNRIVHPETGTQLTLNEAIECDIVDKTSTISIDKLHRITLREALEIGYIDGDRLRVHTNDLALTFEEAYKIGLLHDEVQGDDENELSLVGQTFLVLIKRNRFDYVNCEVINECLKSRMPIRAAIQTNYLMASPSLPNCDESLLLDALDRNLINFGAHKFCNPRSRELMPLADAFDNGYLVLKESNSLILHYTTLDAGNYKFINHIMKTKIIDILAGWKLIASDEILNVRTSERITLAEAERRKIVILSENTNQLRISKSDKSESSRAPSEESNISQNSESRFADNESFVNSEVEQSCFDESQPRTKVNTIIISTLKSITEKFSTDSNGIDEVDRNKSLSPTLSSPKLPKTKELFSNGNCLEIEIEHRSNGIYTLRDAIRLKKITPEICSMLDDGIQLPYTVEDALSSGQINHTDMVEVISNHQIVLLRNHKKCFIFDLQSNFNRRTLVEMGFYDEISSRFVDVWSKRQVSFEYFVSSLEVISDEIYVKDKKAGRYHPISEAFDMKIIDVNNGSYFDTNSQKRISLFDAVQRKLITSSLNEKINLIQIYELEKLMNEGKVDLNENEVIVGCENLTIEEAFKLGFIDANSISVRSDGKWMGWRFTEIDEIVNVDSGIVNDSESGKELKLCEGMLCGLILPRKVRPVSLNSLYSNGFYDLHSNKIIDNRTKSLLSLHQAIKNGLVDPRLSKFVDGPTLATAIETGRIDAEKNLMKDSNARLGDLLKNGMIANNSFDIDLIEMIKLNYYDSQSGLFLDPFTGNYASLAQAVDTNLIDVSKIRIKDKTNLKFISYFEAKFNGLVDDIKGVLKKPRIPLDTAVLKRYIEHNIKPICLSTALEFDMFDRNSKKLTIDNVEMNLHEAIMSNKICGEYREVYDRNSDIFLTVIDSIKSGLVDSIECTIINTLSNREIYLDDAYHEFMILSPQYKLDLEEAINAEQFDMKTLTFKNFTSSYKFTLKTAIQRSLIDVDHTFVHFENKILKFIDAVACNIVDLRNCVLISQNGNSIDFCEAFDTGIMRTLYKPLTLPEATFKGFYDQNNEVCFDPETEEKINLRQAVRDGLIELAEHDDTSCSGMSLQYAVQNGIYDESSCRLLVPHLRSRITMHEAAKRFLVNPYLPVYFDEMRRQLLSLNEAMRRKLIHRMRGIFTEPYSNRRMSMKIALNDGWLLDIETANFSLYKLLQMKLYDIKNRKLVHPKTYQRLSILESKMCKLVNVDISMIKNRNGKFVLLNEAISVGIVDENENLYRISETEVLSIGDAFANGLIVSTEKPYDLKNAIEMSLYRAETGKFIDPVTSRKYDLSLAMKENLINSKTTKFYDHLTEESKSLKEAIDDEEIDVKKGRVYDARTNSFYNYDIAFNNGVLVEIPKSLVAANKDIQPKIMSLEEMILNDIVNIQTSHVKIIQTSELIRLGIFIQKFAEFLAKKIVVSRKSFAFVVDNDYIIYKTKPRSFDELVASKHLNLLSGLISDESHFDKDVAIEEAVNLGFLDSETFIIKNFATSQFEHLEQAIKTGLFDTSKAQIVDPTASKIYNLDSAISNHVLKTPKQQLSLHEIFEFGLYDADCDLIQHPFKKTKNLKTFGELLDLNLINSEQTLVKNPIRGDFLSLDDAISLGIIDKVTGKMRFSLTNEKFDLRKAIEQGLFISAEERQAIIEKFALCEENISILSRWINDIEQRISKVGGITENIEEMQMQVNVLRQIKNDIDLQSHPIASCLEQVRQLVLTSGNALSVSEVATIENASRNLRLRFDRSLDTAQTLTKHLTNGIDDLEKLQVEYRNFAIWLNTIYGSYENERMLLADLKQTSSQTSRIDEMLKEIVARQADIRFITMSTQKFVDETKDYLEVLNNLRSALPERLPEVQLIGSFKSPVRQTVSQLQTRYNEILDQTNELAERQTLIREAYEKYSEHLQKTKKWLSDNQILVSNLVATPVATEVETIQEQLVLAKSLLNTFLSNRKLIDDLQNLLENLLIALTGLITPATAASLEIPVDQARKDYKNLLDAIDNRVKILEISFAQAQETQAALEHLIENMKKADEKLRLLQQPASLIIEKLVEQITEYQFIISEIETIHASLQGVTNSAKELIRTSANTRSTKVIESKLQSASEQFAHLKNKTFAYNEFLDSVHARLKKFNGSFDYLEKELEKLQEMANLEEKSVEILMKCLQDIAQNRKNLQPSVDECLRNGKELIGTKNVTDIFAVRDKLKRLETMWDTLGLRITEKLKLTKQKAEKLMAFENSKKEINLWLSQMEARIGAFDPVALDLKILDAQANEVKKLMGEFENFNKNIKKINQIATEYHSIVRASSPTSTSVDRQDFTDFSFIQQEISDINSRYSFIGMKLNDRKKSINDMKVAVMKQKENLDNLLSFLRKLEKDFPRVNLTLREDAEHSTKIIRRMLNDMLERQDKLEATKLEVRGLIQNRENIPGAENLGIELGTVVEYWQKIHKQLSDCLVCADVCLDFLKNYEILSNWLAQKSKLLSTLGPISPDPRVVKSQLHQISVLKDDFDAQKIHYNNLMDNGRALALKFKDTTAEFKLIHQKLDDIEKRWNDLYSQLSARYKVLSNIVDISEDFEGNCNRLRDQMQKLSDSLDNVQRSSNVEEKAQKIGNIERQIDALPPHLADIESSAATLIKSIEDQQIRTNIANKVEGLNKQFSALKNKLASIKNENDSFLKNKQTFLDNCANAIAWIDKHLSSFDTQLLISAHKGTLSHQLNTNAAVLSDIKGKEHEINMLLNRSRDFDGRCSPNEFGYVEKLKNQWIRLKEESQKRQIRLQKASDIFASYEYSLQKFVQWLEKTEHELNSIQPGMLAKKDLDRELRVVENLKNEVARNTAEFKKVLGLSEDLYVACDVDKDYLFEQKDNLQQRWDELNRHINLKLSIIAELTDHVIDYSEQSRALNALVQRNEDAFDAIEKSEVLGGRKDPRSLEKIRMLREENILLKNNFQNLKIIVEKIVAKARPAGYNCDNLYADLERLSDRILTLESRLDDRFNNLKSATEALADFKKNVDFVGLDLAELEKKVDEMTSRAAARDVKTVRNQIGNAENLLQMVEAFNQKIVEVRKIGDSLIENGYVAKPSEVYGPIDDMKHKRLRLEGRMKDYIDSLNNILKMLLKFYEDYEIALNDVTQIDFELKKCQTISSESHQIKLQKADFVKFKKQVIEPTDRKIGDLNELGRDLIRTAAKDVSTQALENDLEKILSIWNQIKTNVIEHDRKLDQALMLGGKFKDSLDNLLRWLKETEDQVRNQKPPSVDYKVVKAQIHEHKFLVKVIDDNDGPITALCRLSEEIVLSCDPHEKMNIEIPVADLKSRYGALQTKAHDHMELLENAAGVSKALEDRFNSLTAFLDRAEKAFKNLENVPCNEDKIDKSIHDLARLQDDVAGRDDEVTQLVQLTAEIRKYFDHEEAEIAYEKIDNINDRFKMLCDDLSSLALRLEKIKNDFLGFIDECSNFAEWCERQNRALQTYKHVPINVDSIHQQYDKLQSTRDEIDSKKADLDRIAKIAKELALSVMPNEAYKLKDKIDAIEKPYIELVKKAEAYYKLTAEGLSVAEKFQEAHNNLTKWMQDAEEILVTSNSNNFENVLTLENDLPRMRGELELINSHGRQLIKLASEENAATLEGIITRCNRRFEAIVEQIQRKTERFQITLQRSREVNADLDELLAWFRATEEDLKNAPAPSIDPTEVKEQLKNHRQVNDNIITHKGRSREVTMSAKKLMNDLEPYSENLIAIQEKLEDLQGVIGNVSRLSSERLSMLEQVSPLCEHFAASRKDLEHWLSEVEHEISLFTAPGVRVDQIKHQQEKNEALMQTVANHKPFVEKFNKLGDDLAPFMTRQDVNYIHDVVGNVNDRYDALKAELRERQFALEKALEEASQLADKLENMLRSLENTAEKMKNVDPIAALPPKISGQIDENWHVIEDLDKREPSLVAVRQAADEIIAKATNYADPAVREIQKKLERLNVLWVDIQKEVKIRDSSLNDTLAAAEKFWNELDKIMKKLRKIKDALTNQEPVATEPRAIQHQQNELKAVGQEIKSTKPEVDDVNTAGSDLISLVGDNEKPEIRRRIEDLNNEWGNITLLYSKREDNLIAAMEKAMQFHENLQKILDFLDESERRLRSLRPIASEIDEIKDQIGEIKDFKNDVDEHNPEIEMLNRQLNELCEITSVDQVAGIRNGVNNLNHRWDNLKKGINDRHKALENALLDLGQFEHALKEIIVWINKTQGSVDQIKVVPGDAKILELEMAKLRIIVNDTQAHQSSVSKIIDAGKKLAFDSADPSVTNEKLDNLNKIWSNLQRSISAKEREIDEELIEAQNFAIELQDTISWVNEVDGVVSATKPSGALPDTARDQLDKFMDIFDDIERNKAKVERIMAQGDNYLKKHADMNVSQSNLQHLLKSLKQKWDGLLTKANDKKIKLEIALKEANEFNNLVELFASWLTQMENKVGKLSPVSRVLSTVQAQIDELKSIQKEMDGHHEDIQVLEKKGSDLRYFAQKQDGIIIKNHLTSMKHRWDSIHAKLNERKNSLDQALKESKAFYDGWTTLTNWLRENQAEVEKVEADLGSSSDPSKIKSALDKIQKIQRALSAKQQEYDSLLQSGKNLIIKAPKSDEPELKQMINELKELWTINCTKTVNAQRKLEEILMVAGQFNEALNAILDWLKKSKSKFTDESRVHGDIDTVSNLDDQHKRFENDMQSRVKQVESIIENGNKLNSTQPAPNVMNILREVEQTWDFVKKYSVERREKLNEALKDAENLHKKFNVLMEWLSNAEQKLKYAPAAPNDEDESQRLLDEFNEFLRELQNKEYDKDETLGLAENILSKAHPDAVKILKTIIQTIQERWAEISQWAFDREKFLNEHLQTLKNLDGKITDLMGWLVKVEKKLVNLEDQELPDDIPETENLIEEHKEFMENTAMKQNEIDMICKPSRPKPTLKDAARRSQSRMNVMRTASRLSPSAISEAKASVAATGEELPHYGPKFSSSSSTDADFKSPRAKQLWEKWRNVWMMMWNRQKRLHDHLLMLREKAKEKHFDWEDWRKRFLKHHGYKRVKVVEFLKKIDKKQIGLIPKEVFVEEIVKQKLPSKRAEAQNVADMFGTTANGQVDWEEFLIALNPDWANEPQCIADAVHEEVRRLVMMCTCRQKFRVFQVGEGKYRFGAEQKLRLVRVLRSTVMVRVGGGWQPLAEFLLKNDPCRAIGKTNAQLREEFIEAAGITQKMQAFTPRHSISGANQSSPDETRGGSDPSTSFTASTSTGYQSQSPSKSLTKKSGSTRSSLTPNTSRPVSRQGSSFSLTSDDGKFSYKSRSTTPRSSKMTKTGSPSKKFDDNRPPFK